MFLRVLIKNTVPKIRFLFLSVELTLLLRKVEEVGVQEQEIFQEMNMYEKLSALEKQSKNRKIFNPKK